MYTFSEIFSNSKKTKNLVIKQRDTKMLLNSVLLASQKATLDRQVLIERKVCFNQKACNLGRRWTHVPEPTSKVLLSHEFLREKAETISVNY